MACELCDPDPAQPEVAEILVCGCFLKVCETCRDHMWHAATQRDEIGEALRGFDRVAG